MAEADMQLRLLAQDPDDLSVLSAALQDAVTKVGDIHYGETVTGASAQ